MKITEIKVTFDNGAIIEGQHPTGFDISELFGNLGLTADSISNAEPGTWKSAVGNLASILIGVAMKRYGL